MAPLSDDEFELSPEMQSIQFEWTSQLKEIFAWGPTVHPYLGPKYAKEDPPWEQYEPGMPLPDPSDYFTFLQWCGLRDETIHEVAEKFNEENKDLTVPSCGYLTKLVPAGWYDIHFPILRGMVSTYLHMLGAVLDIDYVGSYEGYIKKAIQRGLKPDFAIFCGLHEDDPRAKRDPRSLARWYSKSPMQHIENRIWRHALLLIELMKQKLMYEGKVVRDNDRNYSIVSDKIQEEEQPEEKAIE